MDLRVKPEDDRFYTRCHSRESGNPKCRGAQDYKDFFPLDLRVKPEDDKFYHPLSFPRKRESRTDEVLTSLWISGSSPKMTGGGVSVWVKPENDRGVCVWVKPEDDN